MQARVESQSQDQENGLYMETTGAGGGGEQHQLPGRITLPCGKGAGG